MSDATEITPEELARQENSDALTAAYMSGRYDGRKEAEANVARLTKMVDWLADKCAVHCSDKCTDDANCSIASCLMQHCRHTTTEDWKEAARRAVAAGEE